MTDRHAPRDSDAIKACLASLDERSLENARLRDAHVHAIQLSAALNKINEVLMSAFTPDDVLASLIGEVSEAAGADKCLVIEVKDDEYTITHARNMDEGLLGHPRTAAYFPGFALTAAQRRPILIEDNWNDPRTNKEFVIPHELRAFQLIPLIVDGEVIGVVAFAYDEPRTFDDADAEMAERMATAMSLAMKNAQLHVAEREAREDLGRAQVVGHTGSWRLDTGAGVLRWSDETYRMFGIPVGTPMTYELFLDRVHPDDREFVDTHWTAALSSDPYDIEHRIVVDGEVRWVRERAELDIDEQGALLGGFGSVQDVTERKLAELTAAEAARRIHAANRLLELFVGETGDEMCGKALDVLLEETQSAFGVFGYVNEDGDLACPTMSRIFDQCEMDETDKVIVYKRHDWFGLWGRALREASTLYNNDVPTVPPGHVPISRNMATAIVYGDEVIGLINLANKDTDYTDEDVAFLDGVTERIAPVLYGWIQKGLLDREREAAMAEREAERVRLREIIEDIPVGVALIGRDGAVLEINEETDRIWAGELPKARTVEEYRAYEGYHHDTGAQVQPHEWPGPRAIATGERVEELFDIRRLDGACAAIRVDAIPIPDADGGVARVVVITEDVTQRLQAERLRAAIQSVGASASSTFDVDEVGHRVLTAATEVLGTEGSALLLHEAAGWIVKETVGSSAAKVGEVFSAERFGTHDAILDERQPIVVDDAHADDRLDREALSAMGIGSLLLVPLIQRGEVRGVMAFHRQERAALFTEPEVEFATALVGVASLALDNAALYEREHRIADTLQSAMLVPPEPMTDVAVSYLYRPASLSANVGGDFYDVFRIDDECVGVLIGDVSGKGLAAARHTSLLRHGARAYAFEDADPASVLGNLNRLVHRSTPADAFATVFFGVLDRISGTLRFCGAGHPAGLVARPDRVDVLESRSPIVGAFRDAAFHADETRLAAGDVLVLHTDGLLEARRGTELFGEERMIAATGRLGDVSVEDTPQRLLDEVLDFSGGELRDDIVILCVSRTPPE